VNSAVDEQLMQTLDAPRPTNVAEVIALMEAIDSILPGTDGLKWFNALYLSVTKRVLDQPPSGGWADPDWLYRLDVIFADFYFSAIADYERGIRVADSWRAFFAARSESDIDRIQFALAGMNAHINHDLALALLKTNTERQIVPAFESSQHLDYTHVNRLLEAVMPSALEMLAAGLMGELAQDTGKIGQLLAFWNVCAARELAWDFSCQLHDMPEMLRNAALEVQDKFTGALGRSLLLHV
jgi:Family of unknown function (DUF5995)